MSIAGPTLASASIGVDMDDAEQISHFLARIEGELRLLGHYQHVPLDFLAHLGED